MIKQDSPHFGSLPPTGSVSGGRVSKETTPMSSRERKSRTISCER
jgi:hypothetical protein